jgi:hypothetical protein
LVVKLQKVVAVLPVPPLEVGSAVPENVTAKVPDVVIDEGDTAKNAGTVIPTEVTVPVPDAGVAHVPSPRQNVVADAPVPLFKFDTGKLPDTWVDNPILPQLGATPTPPEISALPVATSAKDAQVFEPEA